VTHLTADLELRMDAGRKKCTTGYACGSSCISMSKQCRVDPSAGPGQQKMKRILALAAGKDGSPEVSGGARAQEKPAAGSGGSTAKPMTTKELRDPVLKYFGVKNAAELLASKDFAMATEGDPPRTLRGKNAAAEWRQLHRMFAGVPRDERNLKEGGSVINGIDILKNFRPWAVFGLDPKKAKKADVDKAFRKLAMKHHPDVGGDRKVFEQLVSMKNSVKALMDSMLQDRIDAIRRKCTTGYGCGSTCISLRKECRTSPRSAIGKQRMKRLDE